MHEFRNAFWRWFLALFVVAFLLLQYLPDSAEPFESAYYAAGIAAALAALIAFFGKLLLGDWWTMRR